MAGTRSCQANNTLCISSGPFKAPAHSPVASYCSFQDVSIHRHNHSTTSDIETQDNLHELSRKGDNEAAFSLGQFYFSRKYYNEAFTELKRISTDDRRARYQVAVMMYDGVGVDIDYASSFEIMMELADKENSQSNDPIASCARYNLGRAYYEGVGCRQSDTEAERLWLMAATKDGQRQEGCVKAMSVLGMLYSRVGELTFDLKKAHYWHQEATGNGNIESQGTLGIMYEYGLGVERDQEASFFCYKRAAENGNLFAMGNLAKFYYKGALYNHCLALAERLSTTENVFEIAKETGCLEHYAKKGVALGCFLYARCFEMGIGVDRNRATAAKLYAKAAKTDVDTVAQMHDQLVCGQM